MFSIFSISLPKVISLNTLKFEQEINRGENKNRPAMEINSFFKMFSNLSILQKKCAYRIAVVKITAANVMICFIIFPPFHTGGVYTYHCFKMQTDLSGLSALKTGLCYFLIILLLKKQNPFYGSYLSPRDKRISV